MERRRPSKAQLYRLKVLRHWANEWKTKPSEMEQHRVNATRAASKKRNNERNRLKFYIRDWPAEMTTEQFNQRLALLASLTARKRASLARLIRRWEFVCFDTKTMLWKNRICTEVV